ncbi:hypothetical protein EJB05_03244 [Eragrostis curvula]|uniref:Uncharacterized protein n=1 Tax=Eragrostis curvula TaxID=38414 RepID=A0A5J9WY30_9POAL|nr:hypothetical protein EJB05_03244 [Eragrostis curvula]
MAGSGTTRSRQKIFVHSFLKAEQKIDWVHVTRKNEGSSHIRVVLAMSSPDMDHWNGVKDIGLMLKDRRCSQKVVSTKIESALKRL